MAAKLLIVGYENTGKSTLISKLEETLFVSIDDKKWPFLTPHINIDEFTTVADMTDKINTAAMKYKDKYGKLPRTIAFDTVTTLYTKLIRYSNNRFRGFDIHSNVNKETLEFNAYIENDLVSNGVNAVIVAHTVYDKDLGKWIVPATGAFRDSGSWLSAVDNSSYLEPRKKNQHIFHRDTRYPTRTVLPKLPDKELVEEYDINAHLSRLEKRHLDNLEFDLS